MALRSFIKNDRFSTATTRSLAAANAPEFDNSILAPEYDHTLLAPEYRGENTALEVDPGRGIQVFYNNNYPPEAVEIRSSGTSDVASLPPSDMSPAAKSKKTMVLLLLATILLVAALSTGLGVGLGQRGENAATILPSSPTTSSNSSLACFLKKDYTSSSLHDGGVVSLGFITNDTSPGQLLKDQGAITIPGPTLGPLGSSDIVYIDNGRQGVAWFNQSKLQIDASQAGPPIPKTPFPFLRIAATYSNSTGLNGIAYLYHQLSDTILAEEVWDSTSGFWITNNITIETTSVSGPPAPSPTPPSFLDQLLKEDARNEQSRKSESSKPTPT
ncbi:MAG: hypothetical protein Q9207_006215 [Kuettlingeria erythrocarpa]